VDGLTGADYGLLAIFGAAIGALFRELVKSKDGEITRLGATVKELTDAVKENGKALAAATDAMDKAIDDIKDRAASRRDRR
jgi:ABC-type transporter Mla subunit MlaD